MRACRTSALIAITLAACARGGSRDHTAPAAAFVAYPASGPAPLHVRFDGTSSHDDVGVATFLWDFGDGRTARGAIADHVYATRGAFPAVLVATDAAGNQSRAAKVIEVTAADDAVPPHAAFAITPAGGVAPIAIHFDAGSSSDDVGVAAFEWDFGDGTSGSGSDIDHLFASAGSFVITLTVRDAAGNAGRAQTTIAVAAPALDADAPRASFTATPLAGLAPLSIHLDARASSDDVGVTRSQFDLGDGRTLDGSVQDAVFAVAGRYTITLTVWD